MKRCPKCSRTFPDESQKFCTVDGGLLISDPVFDPNVTIRATAADIAPQFEPTPDVAATSRELPDLNATIASMANAPTVAFPRNTGPTRTTTADIPPPPPPPGISTMPGAKTNPPQAKKKSKLPLILGAVALVLLLGVAGLAVAFFYVIKPRLDGSIVDQGNPPVENTNTNTTVENTNSSTNTEANTNTNTNSATEITEVPFVPPPGTTKFVNSTTNLDGKLAEHYIEFTFYYPEGWQIDKKAGLAGSSNFVRVERRIPPDFTQEDFGVGWYVSKGNYEADSPAFPRLAEQLSASFEKGFPEYRKVSEGPTKVNSRDAYEFRFVGLSKGTEKGDIQLWGRVIFLPTGIEGHTAGATLVMLATSLAPELSGVEDVGVKGQMPVILESFRFARN